MTILAATDFVIEVATVDFSDHLAAIDMPWNCADLDTTNFASGGNKERIGGLADGAVTLMFLGDYAAAEVDATLWPLRGTLVAVTAKPRNVAVAATNPKYSGNFLLSQLNPINGKVGDLVTHNLTWPRSGALTRATA